MFLLILTIITILLLISLFCYERYKYYEYYIDLYDPKSIFDPIWDPRLLIQTKRNMSYDLRGDIPIPYTVVSPWNNSELNPIHNNSIFN